MAGITVIADPNCPPGPIYYFTKEHPMPDPAPNPKAARAVADGKAPLEYLEPACDEGEARVLFGGAQKYGRRNYRGTEMLWTTYLGSMRRHLLALARGEDTDPDSGEHHLSHIRANTAVLLGAMEAGTLKDDRLASYSTALSDRVHIDGDRDAKGLTAEYNLGERCCLSTPGAPVAAAALCVYCERGPVT